MIHYENEKKVSKTRVLADRKRRKYRTPKHSYLSNRWLLNNYFPERE